MLNSACRLDPDMPPAPVLAAARSHYEPRRFVYMVWSQAGRDRDLDTAATEAGWRSAVELPVMVIAAPIDQRPIRAAALRVVETAADRESFAAIAGETLGHGDDDRQVYGQVLQAVDLYRDGCRAFVVALDDVDAAVAWITVIDGTGLIGWVGTREPFRRRGLGAMVTAAAANAGFALGASLVALQASPMGRPVYAGLGFDTISSETLWAPPSSN
jgi:GNAT superfamily N-acetyltransferase